MFFSSGFVVWLWRCTLGTIVSGGDVKGRGDGEDSKEEDNNSGMHGVV